MPKILKVSPAQKENSQTVSIQIYDKDTLKKFDDLCRAAKSDRTKTINSLINAVVSGGIVLQPE